jgi:hypothetical protein
MKHLYNVLFAGILLAGCAKEEVLPQMGDGDNVAFSSVICADTKVSYSPESDAVRLSWTKGDAIGIYSACAQVPYASNIMYVAEQSDAVSTFMFASPVKNEYTPDMWVDVISGLIAIGFTLLLNV